MHDKTLNVAGQAKALDMEIVLDTVLLCDVHAVLCVGLGLYDRKEFDSNCFEIFDARNSRIRGSTFPRMHLAAEHLLRAMVLVFAH